MKPPSKCFPPALLLLLASLAADSPPTTQPAAPAPPTAVMSEKTYRLFQAVIEKHEYYKPENKQKDLTALETLRTAALLDAAKLQLVRIHSADSDKDAGLAWLLAMTDKQAFVAMPDLSVGRIDRAKVGVIENADPAKVIDATLVYMKGHKNSDWRPAEFGFIRGVGPDGVPSWWGGINVFHLAIVAAARGLDDRAGELMECELKINNPTLVWEADARAWPGVEKGVTLLEKGAPRSEVLAAWKAALGPAHGTHYEESLKEMLSLLPRQIADDEALAKQPALDPQKLSPRELVPYYIARVADVHGQQIFDPGECMVRETPTCDALIKIGRPALPALIDLLDDRRLTRSMGYHRTYDQHPWVLRYQDIAIVCIEAITDIPFYKRSHTNAYLSNETPEIHDQVVADVRRWWKDHGAESELKWQLARLDSGDIWRRIETLHKIEKLDAKAVDPAAILKQWAANARGTSRAKQDLPEIACEFATRGDFSMRQEIRKLAADIDDSPDCGILIYLVRFGEAEDFRFLADLTRRVAAQGPQGFDSWILHTVDDELQTTKNPLAVPLLVSYLDQRDFYGLRGTPRGGVQFSMADDCIATLIRLTAHNEAYDPDGPKDERYAAIDRWQTWWKNQGEAAYEKQHPEIKNAKPAPGIVY